MLLDLSLFFFSSLFFFFLTAGQFLIAKHQLNEFQSLIPPSAAKTKAKGDASKVNSTFPASNPPPPRAITNIVMMGMGEPLLNYRSVVKALSIISDPTGLNLNQRRITLSTSGVAPGIDRLAKAANVPRLAISLHAVRDELRDQIVPINRTYPLSVLMDAVRRYPTHNRRITFEYVMLKDVNDSENDARELVRLLHGIDCLVNLIPFNPWPGAIYESSSNNAIHRFAAVLTKAGELTGKGDRAWLKCTIRWPRGRDIGAACGQLAVKKLEEDIKAKQSGADPIPFLQPPSSSSTGSAPGPDSKSKTCAASS